MNIGERIKKYRKCKGLTMVALSEAVFKSQSSVAAWERGQSFPKVNDINRICKFLGITPNELFDWEHQDMSDRQMINRIYSLIGRMER